MPNYNEILKTKHQLAVKAIEEKILFPLNAEQLSKAEILAIYKAHDISAVWRFGLKVVEQKIDLNFTIPVDFPFAPPRVGFSSPPPLLQFPHTDKNGILCSQPNSSTYSSELPVELSHIVLADSTKLLADLLSGKRKEDFQHEFLSYWGRSFDNNKPPIVSLVNPCGPHRVIRIWNGTSFSIFGEDENDIQSWLNNSYHKKFSKFSAAALIWLPEPLFPEEYPKNSHDLSTVLLSRAPEAYPLLERLVNKNPKELFVLLGSQSSNGPCFAAVTLYGQKLQTSEYVKAPPLISKGFREGHIQPNILAERYLKSGNKVTQHEIERADPLWVHGRSGDPAQNDLRTKKVVIIGCGSVGSVVAKYMATTGVGNILIIDPEKLSRTNTARHFLGARYVNLSKSSILAKTLQEDYPHLNIESRHGSWQTVASTESHRLDAADLIISTTGDWSSDNQLNEWQIVNVDSPHVVYGWTEAYALAGHAVCIVSDKVNGCLRCCKDHNGAFLQICRFDTDTTLQEPACGVTFQPYGFIEVSHTSSLVAELAIETLMGKIHSSTERLRAAKFTKVHELGGEWTKEWRELVAINNGDLIVERLWSRDANCPACS